MNIVSTEAYRELLERVAACNSDETVEVVFVEDVADWCAQRCIENWGNPAAVSIRGRRTDSGRIVIRREIDADWIDGIKARMLLGGFWIEVDDLDTPEKFLTHLLLHELAHLVNDWGQDREDDCDAWAFDRMEL